MASPPDKKMVECVRNFNWPQASTADTYVVKNSRCLPTVYAESGRSLSSTVVRVEDSMLP